VEDAHRLQAEKLRDDNRQIANPNYVPTEKEHIIQRKSMEKQGTAVIINTSNIGEGIFNLRQLTGRLMTTKILAVPLTLIVHSAYAPHAYATHEEQDDFWIVLEIEMELSETPAAGVHGCNAD
jgi:hypothetical protein